MLKEDIPTWLEVQDHAREGSSGSALPGNIATRPLPRERTTRNGQRALRPAGTRYSQRLSALEHMDYHPPHEIAANENKLRADHEFAGALQHRPSVRDSDDAERILGNDNDELILASNPNNKGKAKATPNYRSSFLHSKPEPNFRRASHRRSGRYFDSKEAAHIKDLLDTAANEHGFCPGPPPDPICGICKDPTTVCPLQQATSARHPAHPAGLRVSCPGRHAYCLDCFRTYLLQLIDANNDGKGNLDRAVFPIRCPECTLDQFPEGVTDVDAAQCLSENHLHLWHQQRKLDAGRRLWCPNKTCSAMLAVSRDNDVADVACHVCKEKMCAHCNVRWHENLTCQQYQELPEDERSPEDLAFLSLARRQKWRRCPGCKAIISLTSGCHHMSCRCGTQFCFSCGALWNRTAGGCGRTDRQCGLWDEDMLLDEGNRTLRPDRFPFAPALEEETEYRPVAPPLLARVPRRPPFPFLRIREGIQEFRADVEDYQARRRELDQLDGPLYRRMPTLAVQPPELPRNNARPIPRRRREIYEPRTDIEEPFALRVPNRSEMPRSPNGIRGLPRSTLDSSIFRKFSNGVSNIFGINLRARRHREMRF